MLFYLRISLTATTALPLRQQHRRCDSKPKKNTVLDRKQHSTPTSTITIIMFLRSPFLEPNRILINLGLFGFAFKVISVSTFEIGCPALRPPLLTNPFTRLSFGVLLFQKSRTQLRPVKSVTVLSFFSITPRRMGTCKKGLRKICVAIKRMLHITPKALPSPTDDTAEGL
ncbi:unnamed protein product [Lactuca virosa]|uniref:Uncharacterized protein n=1 Tax=Lactuca virosa TaxID=75947 RepID=A0AAU9NZD1_9ASTR|nr:unnamed protein product [Lactuca virosa]